MIASTFGPPGSAVVCHFDPTSATIEREPLGFANGGPMASYLPIDLEKYIDPSSAFASIRNLTAAAEAGEIPLSSVASFVKACERGEDIRFSKTRPIPMAMREAIERRKDLLPRQVVYAGLKEKLWEYSDVEAWENNQSVLSEARSPARRGVYLTRNRGVSRRTPRTEGRFVPRMSLDALCKVDICDGAKTCLALLLSIAGRESTILTYTSSIATELGRTARTVRNYFIALERAGLIVRTAGRDQNTVRISISADCRPEPYREPEDVRAFKLAVRSSNKLLRMLAFSVSSAAMSAFPSQFAEDGRRKEISAFNPESNILYAHESFDAAATQEVRRKQLGPTTHSDLIRHPHRGIGSNERGRSPRNFATLPHDVGSGSSKHPGPLPNLSRAVPSARTSESGG